MLEHLNVTTFLGGSIIGSPVWGFLPLRAYFSCTENFPNPLMRTSSPFCRDCFISSKKGVDDLGRLGFGENVLGKECFHDMGFCDSHGLLQKVEYGLFVGGRMIPQGE